MKVIFISVINVAMDKKMNSSHKENGRFKHPFFKDFEGLRFT